MDAAFYVAAIVAVAATVRAITGLNAMHALLYLIVSLLAVALIFYLLGAPFAAALEVIVYAGAIMVLVIFVIMMLNVGEAAVGQERAWLAPRLWAGPALLALVLLGELGFVLMQAPAAVAPRMVAAKEVGIVLFGPYLMAVELASLLLLAGVVGAYHLGRRSPGEAP